MSFDRPDLLESVLQTVKRQNPTDSMDLEFYIFQDGWENRTTGENKCDPVAAKACVETFKRYFPGGHVRDAKINLGIAGNFDRAEREFFEDQAFDAGFFFEDDMILQPDYFRAMEKLLHLTTEHNYIGMFSAYGYKVSSPIEIQTENADRLCLMNEHNWAFGLTRRCWIERNKMIQQYLDLLNTIDYRERGAFHPQIHAMQRRLGRAGQGYHSSQDSMKNLACEYLGFFRVTTFTNNAQYIGRTGEHMDESRFYARGYHNTRLYRGELKDFNVPTVDELIQMKSVPEIGF